MRILPLVLLLGWTGCSMAGARETPAETPPGMQEVHIHIDTKKKRLAAYQLEIRFDPSLARIHSVRPCSSSTFNVTPECDPATFGSGRTLVFASSSQARGPDDIHLLTVIFDRVSAGAMRVEATSARFYDSDAKAFHPKVTITPNEVTFAR